MSVSSFLEHGQTFDGKFVILESLGAGGMGEVYKCRQIGVERLVALKLLNLSLADTESSLQRFQREAKILSVLDHRAIARFFLYGVAEDSVPFIAMEYVQGESLRQRLRQLGSIAWRDAVEIAIQVCGALSYAHNKSVIHRDLKPENIILADSERVVLIDFGLAKVADPNWDSLTRTGELIGTTNYLSPELCRGYRPDHRSDLYSLGIILYEMIAGSPPFSADHPMGVIYKHAHETAPSLSVTDLSVPAQVNWIIGRCIAKDPDKRYQSADELHSDLQALVSNRLWSIVAPSAVSKAPGGSSRTVVAISALVAAASFFLFLGKPEVSKTAGNHPQPEGPARQRPQKLSLSDNQLRTMSVETLLSQFNRLHANNQQSKSQDLISRWRKAHEKGPSLSPAEQIDVALALAECQSSSLDYKGALKTIEDSWLSVKDNPRTQDVDKIRVLRALIGNGAGKVSEFYVKGSRLQAPIEEAADELLLLIQKNGLPAHDFETAIGAVIYAKETANQLTDALDIAERSCREHPRSCKGLSRFQAEILFQLGRIEEGKAAAKKFGAPLETSQYRFEPTDVEQEIANGLKAAMCAIPAGRYDIAMELLKPTLDRFPNHNNISYADALANYAEWRMLNLTQKSVSKIERNAAIDESISNLAESGRILHMLKRCHLERQSLAKIVGWQLVLGRENEAERTLQNALQVADQETEEDVRADLASMLYQNVWVIHSVSPGPAELAVLRKAVALLKDVDDVRFASLKELLKQSLIQREAKTPR